MKRLQKEASDLEAAPCRCQPSAQGAGQAPGKEKTGQLHRGILPATRQDGGPLGRSGTGPENGPRTRGPPPDTSQTHKEVSGRMKERNYPLKGSNSNEKFEYLL